MLLFTEKDFLPYMDGAEKCSAAFASLDEKWENIKLLCEMACPRQSQTILPQMAQIQKNFSSLQKELVAALTKGELRKLRQEITPKAQAAIDMLACSLRKCMRDAECLAGDGGVRRFAALGASASEKDRESVLERISAYAEDNGCYSDVIILDKNLKVLANTDPENAITGETVEDRSLRAAMEKGAGPLETFGESPLRPGRGNAHIFSCSVTDGETGEAVGAACLCFKTVEAVHEIFKETAAAGGCLLLSIIDEKGTVVASGDESCLPAGTQVETYAGGGHAAVCYRGLEYIVKAFPAAALSGYSGLGWKAHAMVPLGIAFKSKAGDALAGMDDGLRQGMASAAYSFSEELGGIMLRAEKINRSLKSIVFNGQLITNESGDSGEFTPLRPLLHYMNRMGSDIDGVFENAVKGFFGETVSSGLRCVLSLASLCSYSAGRMVYGHAGDCRRWALDPSLRDALATGGTTEELRGKLDCINSLYTVYSGMFVFDAEGRVTAVSGCCAKNLTGKKITDKFISDILSNSDETKYFVSPFRKSHFYGGNYTYICAASVTDPVNPSKTVGGIGAVFDSDAQLRHMLEQAKPDGEKSFCALTDKSGGIILSTRGDMPAGTKLGVPERFFKTEKGKPLSEILAYDNMYYAVGCACLPDCGALVFVFKAIAAYGAAAAEGSCGMLVSQSDISLAENEAHSKLVSFVVSGRLAAVEEKDVVESVDSGGIINIPESNELIRGAVVYKNRYVPVIDTHMLFGGKEKAPPAPHLLIIRLPGGMLAAMEADQLNNVLEVNESDIKPIPDIGKDKSIIKGVVCFENAGRQLMLVINHNVLPERMDKDILNADFTNVLPFLEKIKGKKKAGADK